MNDGTCFGFQAVHRPRMRGIGKFYRPISRIARSIRTILAPRSVNIFWLLSLPVIAIRRII
jgi:hypothetical protein